MTNPDPSNTWAPARYDHQAQFVRDGGLPVVELLAAAPGERVLDLGCGPGKLTQRIAEAGASVVGLDASAEMIEEARREFPELEFVLGRGEALEYEAAFDAIFSNAALHWMPRARDVVRGMRRALRPGGRVALEFGGFGNVAAVRASVGRALFELGAAASDAAWSPWYFPKLGEYAALLESEGFLVRAAAWFPRPSPMSDTAAQSGLASWLDIFSSELIGSTFRERRAEFLRIAENHARPALYRDGVWWIDYVRLRVEAVRTDNP